jgi:hypothetical protein
VVSREALGTLCIGPSCVDIASVADWRLGPGQFPIGSAVAITRGLHRTARSIRWRWLHIRVRRPTNATTLSGRTTTATYDPRSASPESQSRAVSNVGSGAGDIVDQFDIDKVGTNTEVSVDSASCYAEGGLQENSGDRCKTCTRRPSVAHS